MNLKQLKTSKRDVALWRKIEAERLKSLRYATVQVMSQFKSVRLKVYDHIQENIADYKNPQTLELLKDPNSALFGGILRAANDPEGIAKMLYKIWLKTGKDFIELTSQSLKSHSRFGIIKKSNGLATFSKSIDFSFWTALVNTFITTLFVKKITAINETSRLAIVRFISNGISSGLSIDNIAKEILSGKIAGIDRRRAIMIARTEVIASSNSASLETAKSTKVKGLKKRWLVRIDGRERMAHAEAGERYNAEGSIPLDSPFMVDGDALLYPGDPNGKAANVINCRCAVAYVTRRFG